MGFYDHFHASQRASLTSVGRKLVDAQNKYYLRLVRKYCQTKAPAILEIGCGRGYFAECCRDEGLTYSAIEANRQMAADLAGRGFTVHNAFAPPLIVPEKVDVVFMDQVFEHMNGRDQAVEMLRECRGQLTHGGIIVISSPDVFTWKHDFYADYTHSLPTCMPMLERIFLDCELDIVRRGVRVVLRSWPTMDKTLGIRCTSMLRPRHFQPLVWTQSASRKGIAIAILRRSRKVTRGMSRFDVHGIYRNQGSCRRSVRDRHSFQ
jgi:SAM-dependent methyltransferase